MEITGHEIQSAGFSPLEVSSLTNYLKLTLL